MKGATALLCANTNSTPNNSIITRMGSSQYFLRVLRNAQNSFRNGNIVSFLKLISHGLGSRPRRLPRNPVRPGARSQAQRVFFQDPEQKTDGRDHQEENHSGHHRAHHAAEQQPELSPDSIQRTQPYRLQQSDAQKQCSHRQPPPTNRMMSAQREQRDQSEKDREDDPKTAVGAALAFLFPAKILVQGYLLHFL